MGQLPKHLVALILQEQVSYEVLKISHTFSMDDSGTQTCLQHENMLVPDKTIGSEHMFTSLILLYLAGAQAGGSSERILTIGETFVYVRILVSTYAFAIKSVSPLYPNCLHAVKAAFVSSPFLHTVLHVPSSN